MPFQAKPPKTVWCPPQLSRLRRLLSTHADLAHKLEELEKKYDSQFQVVFEAIRQLMAPPPEEPKKQIGFQVKEAKARYRTR